jgi:small-conductance mechanosensitive channel
MNPQQLLQLYPTIGPVLLFAFAILLGYTIRRFLVLIIARIERLFRNETRSQQEFFSSLAARTYTLLIAVALLPLFGALLEQTPERYESSLRTLSLICLVVQLGLWIDATVTYLLRRKVEISKDTAQLTILGTLSFFSRIVVWVVLTVLVADNLGLEVRTLVAGLGIGGIALALAVQTVLGDLLNSLALVFDKPFEVGDAIRLPDGMVGTVERIGIRSTRIRNLSGEEVIIPNSDLSKSRIQNFRRMERRRVVSVIGVTYSTPIAVMEKLPGMISSIIESIPGTQVDRSHFRGFGESSLELEFVYFALSREYKEFMDIQQQVNLEIMRRFESLGVSFAFPSRTVYLSQGSASDP